MYSNLDSARQYLSDFEDDRSGDIKRQDRLTALVTAYASIAQAEALERIAQALERINATYADDWRAKNVVDGPPYESPFG